MDKIIKNNNIDKKHIFFIAIIAILLLIIIGLLFYINLSKDTSTTITATVQSYSDGYIITKDNDTKDKYLLEVEEEYYENDIVKVTIDDIDDSKKIKTGKITKIKLLERENDSAENIEVIEENTTSTESSNKESSGQESSSSNIETRDITNNNATTANDSNTTNSTKYTEDDVITYFNETKSETDKSPTATSKIKNGFVSIVDFLFYGGTIKGYTFKDLSTSAKLKVLRLALAIDTKIDSKFPDYKKTLSEKYQNVKSKIVSTYLTISADVCSKNEETCASAKEGLTEMKTNFKITWSFIKDISGVGLSKLKSWYAVWKDA